MPFVVFMLVVYPIGIPLLYAVLVFRERHVLSKPVSERTEAENKQVKYLSSIAGAYTPQYMWFEVRRNPKKRSKVAEIESFMKNGKW